MSQCSSAEQGANSNGFAKTSRSSGSRLEIMRPVGGRSTFFVDGQGLDLGTFFYSLSYGLFGITRRGLQLDRLRFALVQIKMGLVGIEISPRYGVALNSPNPARGGAKPSPRSSACPELLFRRSPSKTSTFVFRTAYLRSTDSSSIDLPLDSP